jgi:cholesterol oxidase
MSAPDADVIVIGSGFGGSIAANRLALAGFKVLVIERGPWRDSLPVRSMGISSRAPFPYGRKAVTHLLRTLHVGRWALTLNRSGLYEVFFYPGLVVFAVSAVGGGSHGWFGLLVEPQDRAYWRGRHPELEPDAVEKYYGKIQADMEAFRLSRDHWLRHSVWAELPPTPGRECHPADPQPYLAIKLPYAENEVGQLKQSEGGVERRTCAYDGDGFLGSRDGAKASVDFIYLAPALNNGATVRDMCEVTKIIRRRVAGDTGYTVQFSNLRKRTKEAARAKRVILAAGTMSTLRLLFAGSAEPGGLNPMPSLGRTFGGNGDLIGAWFKNSVEPSMLEAAPVLGQFTVAGRDVPFVGMWAMPGIETLPLPPGARKKLAKTVPLIGMGADTGNASARYAHGAVLVDYDPNQQPIFEKIRAAFRALAADSGLKTWAIKKPITVHAWGGACLGAGPDRGVVDHHGEVYGNPGLFVADAAALPAACGTPPSLAIAAWAHHVADGLAQRAK